MTTSISATRQPAPRWASATTAFDIGRADTLDRKLVRPHRIADLAERAGDKAAIIDVEGRSVTYRELHDEVMRWAAAYQRAGLRPGRRS